MKKKIIKYLLLIGTITLIIIIYLSVFGFETDKFNKDIKAKILKIDNNLNLELKKINFTLDPFNLRLNAKTIGSQLKYKKKTVDLEFIKTQISLKSLFENKLISLNLKISTKSVLLKDLISFVRVASKRPEIFSLEPFVKKGHIIIDLDIDFDEKGKIKDNYKIRGLLKDGKIELSKNYNFEKINFTLNIKNNFFYFQNTNFTTNKINFFLENLKIIKKEKDYFFDGTIENKNSILNRETLDLVKKKWKNIELQNINFSSKNIFSFKVDKKLKFKNIILESKINIDKFNLLKPDLWTNYLPEINNVIYLKDHNINLKYKENSLSIKGIGKAKLQNQFDKIEYLITKKNKDLKLFSNISLNKLTITNQNFLKNLFPKAKDKIYLKNHTLAINYKENFISFNGSGKIQIENQFDNISYLFSRNKDLYNFDTKLDLDKTSLNIDYLNYTKKKNLVTHLELIGSFQKDKEIILDRVNIFSKKNNILINNIIIDSKNRLVKVDKIDMNYLDNENKKNQFILQRLDNDNYELQGSIFNSNTLISNLLKTNEKNDKNLLIEKIDLSIKLDKVFIDNENIITNLNGKLKILDNRIFECDIEAFFKDNKNLTFTIKTNDDEKVTTFYSHKAKPFVQRYKFIKGFEDGDLNFYSTKKNNISNSVLKIDNFKVQEIPVLAKILTLASLQGIADLLTGEGIKFTDFEMKFSNKEKIITIEELYAIGPSISILMEGYVQSNELISLRGTLVPASTINRTIASIPVFGDFLIGKKVGEGVFGVSFKIKGPPKDLKTTVNPVKSLTPRFITRTLEKIKKN